jgi:hypothetical protein
MGRCRFAGTVVDRLWRLAAAATWPSTAAGFASTRTGTVITRFAEFQPEMDFIRPEVVAATISVHSITPKFCCRHLFALTRVNKFIFRHSKLHHISKRFSNFFALRTDNLSCKNLSTLKISYDPLIV